MTTITLRTVDGATPLANENIERTVRATAHAIAERTGIEIRRIETDCDCITVTLDCARIASLGFAAELRRLTERWYVGHTGGETLWGVPPTEPDSGGDDLPEPWTP